MSISWPVVVVAVIAVCCVVFGIMVWRAKDPKWRITKKDDDL